MSSFSDVKMPSHLRVLDLRDIFKSIGLPGECILGHGGWRRIIPAVAIGHWGQEARAWLVGLPGGGRAGQGLLTLGVKHSGLLNQMYNYTLAGTPKNQTACQVDGRGEENI